MSEWKLVPVEPTDEMLNAGSKEAIQSSYSTRGVYFAMLAAAPMPTHETLTPDEAREKQDWKGMDGAIAFHLIERHADGWDDVGLMMNAWLEANRGTT
jgi:hypothetical protein